MDYTMVAIAQDEEQLPTNWKVRGLAPGILGLHMSVHRV